MSLIRTFPWLLFFLLLACSSIRQRAPENALFVGKGAAAQVRIGWHIRKFAGKQVTAIGRYRILLDYSVVPPHPTKRAELLLRDGFGIVLGRGEEGLRPKRERKKLSGKVVRIRATLHFLCKLNTQGYFSNYEAACFTGIENIQPVQGAPNNSSFKRSFHIRRR